MIVLDDIEFKSDAPLSWAPAQIDANKPGGSLGDWLKLPWGCPSVVALPGYRTIAENGMRGKSRGNEMLISTCAMMGSGARTILLSRWRTGGRQSMDLVTEFFEGRKQQSAAEAWQRSVQLARSAELDPTSEPRLKNAKAGEIPSADHPFFWAGYMVVGH